MAILRDYYCAKCDTQFIDGWSDDVPRCCGRKAKPLMSATRNHEWGGPRQYLHLRDEPFGSKSELNAWAKAKGLSLYEASEKVGGARNDMYEGVGKIFSYGGQSSRRGNALYSAGSRRQ